VIETKPVEVTVELAPTPVRTVAESTASTSPAATPAPSAAAPRNTVTYAGVTICGDPRSGV
jgi:hypothetical protein